MKEDGTDCGVKWDGDSAAANRGEVGSNGVARVAARIGDQNYIKNITIVKRSKC
jgi:hypothetical protein